MKIVVRISTAWKVWDFNFFRGLAPGCLDGFLMKRDENKREFFGLSAVWLESLDAGAVQKNLSTLSLETQSKGNSESFKIAKKQGERTIVHDCRQGNITFS